MTGRVAGIWRHPIKAHGREALEQVNLLAGRTMPWDRTWAVAHAQAKTDGRQWAHCANFSRGAKAPTLQAITSQLNETSGQITLSHPDKPDITFRPDDDPASFLDWVRPLMPPERAASARIIRVPGRGMTDTDFPSISLLNLSSNRALGQHLGQDLSIHRWRGNFWLDGLGPWEEFEWVGKSIRIGSAVIEIREPIGRCMAPAANPDTGRQDADILGALEAGWGHTNFGVCGEVVSSGQVTVGADVELLP